MYFFDKVYAAVYVTEVQSICSPCKWI